ncbi:MAG TPA: histidine phosphatase family protein [Gaiellaceae bacterium]|nr:histidine phosphatase family protein [Gaiellaceae bacterium]
MSVDNEQGIATGWLDGELSPRGRELAQALGERRRAETDVVYTSDLGRALETAELAFGGSEVPVQVDARLRECDYGELNGHPVAEIDAERLRRIEEPFPGGESYRDVIARTRSFLDDVRARHEGERVLAIAHSANRWALQHLLEGTPLEELIVAPFDWQPGWEFRL